MLTAYPAAKQIDCPAAVVYIRNAAFENAIKPLLTYHNKGS